MRRIVLFIVVFYLVGFAVIDSVSYHGYYRQAVWNQANYQVYRVYYEVRVILDRMGLATTAVARPW